MQILEGGKVENEKEKRIEMRFFVYQPLR